MSRVVSGQPRESPQCDKAASALRPRRLRPPRSYISVSIYLAFLIRKMKWILCCICQSSILNCFFFYYSQSDFFECLSPLRHCLRIDIFGILLGRSCWKVEARKGRLREVDSSASSTVFNGGLAEGRLFRMFTNVLNVGTSMSLTLPLGFGFRG